MQRTPDWIKRLAGLLAVLMLFSTVGGSPAIPARAASSAELREELNELGDEAEELEAQMAQLESQMTDHRNEMAAMVEQKDLIDQQILLLFQKQDNLNKQIAALALLIADKQEELLAAEENLARLQEKHKDRIRAMEENGELDFWYVLFHASSFMDMLDQLAMIEEIRRADARRLEELDQATKAVETAKENLEAEQAALQETRKELTQLQKQLEEKRAQVDALLIEMKKQADEFEAMMEESEARQEALMQQMAQVNNALEDARYQEWLAQNGGAEGNATWLMPCKYSVVTDTFGVREYHPVTGEPNKMHNGIDLAGAYKTPIYASRSGYVQVAAFQKGGAGNYVLLNHGDGFKSIYMHMTNYIVKVGQYVKAGEVIGYMGSSGGSTGVHLHFGISYNGTYVNPANYIYFR